MPLVGKASTPKKNPQTGTTEAWFGGSRQGARRSGARGVAAWVSREKQQKRERGGGMCEKKDREEDVCERQPEREYID